jgi:hypothetical protein
MFVQKAEGVVNVEMVLAISSLLILAINKLCTVASLRDDK